MQTLKGQAFCGFLNVNVSVMWDWKVFDAFVELPSLPCATLTEKMRIYEISWSVMSQLLTQLFSETQPLNCCCCYGAVFFWSNIGISLDKRPKTHLVFERPSFLCCLRRVLQPIFINIWKTVCNIMLITKWWVSWSEISIHVKNIDMILQLVLTMFADLKTGCTTTSRELRKEWRSNTNTEKWTDLRQSETCH